MILRRSPEEVAGAIFGVLVAVVVMLTPFVLGERQVATLQARVIQVRADDFQRTVEVRWTDTGETETLYVGQTFTQGKLDDEEVGWLVPGEDVYLLRVCGVRIPILSNRVLIGVEGVG